MKARGQSNAWAFVLRLDQSGRPVPAVYEECLRCSNYTFTAMYAHFFIFYPLIYAYILIPGLNDTANPADRVCPISDLCGFGGIKNNDPNQWFRWASDGCDLDSQVCRLTVLTFRFITPIFLHAGIIHLLLNMLAQIFVAAQASKSLLRF